MDEQLNQVAEQTGVPAALLERAAKARAASQGIAVEALVAGWAGGAAPAAPAAPAPAAPAPAAPAPAAPAPPEAAAPAPAAPAPPEAAAPAAPAAPAAEAGAGKLPDKLLRRSAAAKAKREGRPLDEVLAEMGLSPEGAPSEASAVSSAAAPSAGAPTPSTAPAAGTPADAAEPAETTEPQAEQEPERVLAGFPRWLAASFVIIPMIALLYAGFAPNGPNCGASGKLAVNPVSGETQSCSGSGSVFFTQGMATYTQKCVACHSADGSGGVGPAFNGGAVLQTFSACTDQITWVTTGSAAWPNPTYGDTNKPVLGFSGAPMPSFSGALTDQQIASVVLYERVAFGGADPITEEANCGLTAAGG